MFARLVKADFHSAHNVARSTFSERFLLNYNSQAEQISLAVVDFTHFKRKRSLKIDRATFCTEWKSAFTSCQQVWNKLLTTCNNLVDIIRLVTRLFQQACYNHDITILLQPCIVNLVTFLLYHDCVRLVRTTFITCRSDNVIKLVTNC